MPRIRLIHWNEAEAAERGARLRALGYEVDAEAPKAAGLLRALRSDPPAAVVIDLSRLPMQGRDVAFGLRLSKATRGVPLVFAGGDPEKVAVVRSLLPDAAYTTWGRMRASLGRAIASPPADPVVPRTVLEGYSGTPLPKKLGIRPGTVAGLANAPEGFRRSLGELPEGAVVRDPARGTCDVVVWFVRTEAELLRGLASKASIAGRGSIWIAWPKRASGAATDLTQAGVRGIGLAAGLVDYKVCSIDATWSGLLFTRRKTGRAR